jgi:hypothetical protein
VKPSYFLPDNQRIRNNKKGFTGNHNSYCVAHFDPKNDENGKPKKGRQRGFNHSR